MAYRWLLVAILLGAGAVPAVAKTVQFSSYGAWKISAGMDKYGRVTYCSASGRYSSGTHFSIMYSRRQSTWSLLFLHRSWPHRTGTTPVILRVDGRDLKRTKALFYKNGVVVRLGRDINRVKRFMRGRQLSVVTSKGRSSYSLKGSSGATLEVAKCIKYYAKRSVPRRDGAGGAFGSNPNSGGAFGGASNRRGSGGAFGGGSNNSNRSGGAFGGGNNRGNSGNSGSSGGYSGGGWQ